VRADSDLPIQHAPGEVPLYSFAEAARYLGIPDTTLRSWVSGRKFPRVGEPGYSPPVIKPAALEGSYRLSFNNLIEIYVLRALRTKHSVKLSAIRKALDYAEKQLRIRRLLIHPQLKTTGGDLFLEEYGQLISLNRSGQIAMKEILKNALERIEWEDEFPARLFLPVREIPDRKSVSVDPLVRYGQPAVEGVETKILAARVDAGEAPEDVAADYRIPYEAVIDAIVFESTLTRAA